MFLIEFWADEKGDERMRLGPFKDLMLRGNAILDRENKRLLARQIGDEGKWIDPNKPEKLWDFVLVFNE